MRSVMNAQQMRAVDRYMMDQMHIPSLVLMENAAMGTAQLVMEQSPDPCVVHVFCGTGNNGGDGLACARILLSRGYDVYVVVLGNPRHFSEDAAANFAMFEQFPDRLLVMSQIEDLYGWRVPKAAVILDAIFGTGLAREVLGMHADVIASINSAQAYRIAVDIPSGIDTDTGQILGTAVEADCTATFQYPKMGHYLFPGRSCTGELHVIPIGVDTGIEEVVECAVTGIQSDDPDIMVPARTLDSNKGTYGKLLLVAGSRGMAGAAVMSSHGAYASGAGLVTVGSTAPVIDIIQGTVPEATCAVLPEDDSGRIFYGSIDEVARAAEGRTALAIGPGLGEGAGLKELVSEILTTYSIPRVVDADALNALDKDLKVLSHIHGDVIFTPHPLEFARLLGTQVSGVLEHPVDLALAFAEKCKVTLVLKGATTIIASPEGGLTLVAAGTPGMSKGGSGDVLTGVIGGFLAQGVPVGEAAVLGVYVCAMAGEAAASEKGEYSMTPGDEIRHIGRVIEDITAIGLPVWRPATKEKWIPPTNIAAQKTRPQGLAKNEPWTSSGVVTALRPEREKQAPAASSAPPAKKRQEAPAEPAAARASEREKSQTEDAAAAAVAASAAAATAAIGAAAKDKPEKPVAQAPATLPQPEEPVVEKKEQPAPQHDEAPASQPSTDRRPISASPMSTQEAEPADDTPKLTKRDRREERRAEARRKEYAQEGAHHAEEPAGVQRDIDETRRPRSQRSQEPSQDRRPLGQDDSESRIPARVETPRAAMPARPTQEEMREARRIASEQNARRDAEERQRAATQESAGRRALLASEGEDNPQVRAAREALEAAMARREGREPAAQTTAPARNDVEEELEPTTTTDVSQLPRAVLRKPADRFEGSSGRRMSATDIRPPRIPKTADMSSRTIQAGSARLDAQPVSQDTAEHEPVRDLETTRQATSARRPQGAGPGVDEPSERQRRDQLNAEIQSELRRKGRDNDGGGGTRTRRRIG